MLVPRTPKTSQQFDGMIGSSRLMRRVYRQVEKVARLEVPVLVTGESGTGKELVAQSVHQRSGRADGPFVPVNTGAISSELIASELFGHEKGAFTGASFQKKGHFEAAQGGTLFLDEITTMDMKTQISLLRVLETMQFRRVGGRAVIRADVRIVAASNQDLRASIREGTFREDLYHRLNVFNIKLPPLRRRKDDIPLLAAYFAKRYGAEFGKEVAGLQDEAVSALRSHSWPGNVRELENAITRMLIMAHGDILTVDHLPAELNKKASAAHQVILGLGMTLEQVEREYIVRTLESVDGNKTEAAQILAISRKALYNKMERHRIPLSGPK